MASIVQHLIPESQTPETLVTATEEMTLQQALERMMEYDYSQLPVVDQDFKLKGLITSDSILTTVSYFKTSLDKISVSHAAFKSKTCRPDDELSELLNGLRDASAIPIVDKAGELIAIVTNYDTAEYYRQRAEDIMLAQDIETTLRDYIEHVCKDGEGNIDIDALRKEIKNITPSGNGLKNKFKKALCEYLGHPAQAHSKLDLTLINDVFEKHLYQPTEVKPFEDLTLFDYIQILKNLWNKYQHIFNQLEWNAIYRLLDEVRQTRNAIAHFREVTANQRKQLKYCAQFLENHKSILDRASIISHEGTLVATTHNNNFMEAPFTGKNMALSAAEQSTADFDFEPPVEEELGSNESRYAPLALWLQTVNAESSQVALTFKEVEDIIDDHLPPSARQHRNWWANDSVGHTQSQQWLDVDWRVSNVNIAEERVVFSRMDGRQKSYIHFFNNLLPQLRDVQDLMVEPAMNPQGQNWFAVKIKSPELERSTYLAFSFVRRSRFRIELYIDTGDSDKNKRLFDQMYSQKVSIQADMGQPLQWERLDTKRASRIALYKEQASITQEDEKLSKLQEWAVEVMKSFYHAVAKKHQEAEDMVVSAS